jgi:asparagine synthase (glutamine-hydrolysing)
VDSPVLADVFQRDFLVESVQPELARAEAAFAGFYEDLGAADEINRRLAVDIRTSLVDEMLTKVDRMSMAFGLEARVPLLDHRLVEFAASLPGTFKAGALGAKHVLKQASQPHLPAEIVGRPKTGFNLPLPEWFRDRLGAHLQDRMSSPGIARAGIFDVAAVARLLDAHRSGARDHSAILFAVLVWALWFERWLETDHPQATTAQPAPLTSGQPRTE